MIKRVCFMALALTLICAIAFSDAIVNRAISVIGKEESNFNYSCAVTDTNGKASLGFMQWNGSRAAALLREIIALDEYKANDILGEELVSDIKVWKSCVLTSSQRASVRELLGSDAGKTAQDAKAQKDVKAYVNSVKKLGMVDPTAICYYCDIVHQVGTGAAVKYHKDAASYAGGYANIKLDHLYKAALNYATHTKQRRMRVYKLLLNNPVGESEKPETGLSLSVSGTVKLERYKTLKLEATLSGSSETVYWKSSNIKAAKVTKSGVVRGVRRGKARITAYTASGLSDSVIISVVKPNS